VISYPAGSGDVSPASEMGPAVRHDLGATWPGYVSIMVWLGRGSSTGVGRDAGVQSPGLPTDRPGRAELINLRMRRAVQTGKLVGSGGLVCVAGQGVTGLPVREERSWTRG
jgi:hypothetical protein